MIEDIGITSQPMNLGEIHAHFLLLCVDFQWKLERLYVSFYVSFRSVMETPTVRGIPLLEFVKVGFFVIFFHQLQFLNLFCDICIWFHNDFICLGVS